MKPSPNNTHSRPATPLPIAALLALSAIGFLTMLTETIPAGLLPQLSHDLRVSTGTGGQLVSVYALGSVLAALPLTALTRHWPRRRLLLCTLVIIGVVNLVTATSPVYAITLVARLFAGLAAGVQWALIAGCAMRLVPTEQSGRALAISMAGVPLGLALGVPAGTALGSALGWRLAFGLLALACIPVTIAIMATLPPAPGEKTSDHPPVRRVLVTPGLPIILASAFAFEVAHMNAYTYIAPLLERAGLGSRIGGMLLVFGIAALVGLWATGALLDRHRRTVTIAVLAQFTVCLLILTVAARSTPATILAVAGWGMALGAAPTVFQAASARAAGPAADVAQAMLVTALNAGMAGGAALGAITLTTEVDNLVRTSLLVFAATFVCVALARRHAFPPTTTDRAPHPAPSTERTSS